MKNLRLNVQMAEHIVSIKHATHPERSRRHIVHLVPLNKRHPRTGRGVNFHQKWSSVSRHDSIHRWIIGFITNVIHVNFQKPTYHKMIRIAWMRARTHRFHRMLLDE